ncbi:MAG: hypothetical protein ACYC0F_05200 [Rhodanobacter sp.]
MQAQFILRNSNEAYALISRNGTINSNGNTEVPVHFYTWGVQRDVDGDFIEVFTTTLDANGEAEQINASAVFEAVIDGDYVAAFDRACARLAAGENE